MASGDLDGPIRRLEARANDRAVLNDQRAGGVIRLRLDATVETRSEQATDEALTAAALVTHQTSRQLGLTGRIRNRLAERCFAHCDVWIGEVRRAGDSLGPLAELGEREDRALDGASTVRTAARKLRVVVGHAGDRVELHRSLRLQQRDHLWASIDVGLDEVALEQIARQRHDVLD